VIGLISYVVPFHGACVLFVLIGKFLGYEAPGRRDDDVTGLLAVQTVGTRHDDGFSGVVIAVHLLFSSIPLQPYICNVVSHLQSRISSRHRTWDSLHLLGEQQPAL
jgi:membrane glycosyltransferase